MGKGLCPHFPSLHGTTQDNPVELIISCPTDFSVHATIKLWKSCSRARTEFVSYTFTIGELTVGPKRAKIQSEPFVGADVEFIRFSSPLGLVRATQVLTVCDFNAYKAMEQSQPQPQLPKLDDISPLF